MSEIMLHGVLNAPVEAGDVIGVLQLQDRAKQASKLIKKQAEEITRLRAEIKRLNLKNDITHDKGMLKGIKKAFDICYTKCSSQKKSLEDIYINIRESMIRDIERALQGEEVEG